MRRILSSWDRHCTVVPSESSRRHNKLTQGSLVLIFSRTNSKQPITTPILHRASKVFSPPSLNTGRLDGPWPDDENSYLRGAVAGVACARRLCNNLTWLSDAVGWRRLQGCPVTRRLWELRASFTSISVLRLRLVTLSPALPLDTCSVLSGTWCREEKYRSFSHKYLVLSVRKV